MKGLAFVILLGPLALLLAGFFLRRRQKAPRLVRSPFLLGSLRLAAVIMVLLGAEAEAPAQEETNPTSRPSPRIAPEIPGEEALERWHEHLRDRALRASFRDLLAVFIRPETVPRATRNAWIEARTEVLPVGLGALVRAELEALLSDRPAAEVTADTVLAALREVDDGAFWFLAVTAFLERSAARLEPDAGLEERAAVLAGIWRHRRLAQALVLAMARAKPIALSPRAWASKAGPGRQLRLAEAQARRLLRADLEETLGLPEIDDDATAFRLAAGALVLVGAGREPRRPERGEGFTFGQFDLMRADEEVLLDQAWLGAIRVPKDRVIGVRDLPELLDEEQRALVARTIARALAGDLVAQGLLELSLPLVHAALAARLAEKPEAAGIDALRMILRRHDGLLVPLPADFRIERGAGERSAEEPDDQRNASR